MLCFVSSIPSPHTPIHKGGGLRPPPQQWAGAFGTRPTVVDSFMDRGVGAGKAADAAKHT